MAKKSGKANKKRGPAAETTKVDDANLMAETTQANSMTLVAESIKEEVNILGKANSECGLLKLPAEIKQRIWTLAIAVDEPLSPVQVRERSNMFLWSTSQLKLDNNNIAKKSVKEATSLTVIALSRVCRTFYEEISLTHLFYKVNNFEFLSHPRYARHSGDDPINYLVALTTPRMKAIRSIKCDWSGSNKEASKMFTIFAACDGLQNLGLVLHFDFQLPLPLPSTTANQKALSFSFSKVPGLKEALIAVEGLRTLKLTVCEGHEHWCHGRMGKIQASLGQLETILKERMKMPRGSTRYSLGTMLMAQREAQLEIHGDGRLGEDKRPGIVASRTRNQLRKQEQLTNEGTIPKRILPKYDADGDLAWQVQEILASRKSEPDGFPPSVEFKVKCYSLTGMYTRSDLPAEISWEDLSVMGMLRSRSEVTDFYQRNPTAYGKEETIEAFNLRDDHSGMTVRELKYYRSLTNQIITVANRQFKIEEQEAEAAAREAIKAVKDPKDQKQKKARKSKTS